MPTPDDRFVDTPPPADGEAPSPAAPAGDDSSRGGEPSYLRRRGLERLNHGLPRRR